MKRRRSKRHTWLVHAGLDGDETLGAIAVVNIEGGRYGVASGGCCNLATGAVTASSGAEAVCLAGHAVGVDIAVLGAPGVGQGVEVQTLAGHNVCRADKQQRTALNNINI